MAGQREIAVTVNGQRYEATVEVRQSLVDFLREGCGLTGTHVGCEHGVCGACTVLLDGETVRSCIVLAVQANGADILTVEGLGNLPPPPPATLAVSRVAPSREGGSDAPHVLAAASASPMGTGQKERLHPLQVAFWEHHGLQCGYCTPGFLLTALELLREHPDPSEEEIREALSGNLCICTGYVNIVRAVQSAARVMRGEPSAVSPQPSAVSETRIGDG